MRQMMVPVDDGRRIPGGKMFEIERRFEAGLLEPFAQCFHHGLTGRPRLAAGALEIEHVVQAGDGTAGGHGDDINAMSAIVGCFDFRQ